MAGLTARAAIRFAAHAALRPYAQVIFSRDLASGACVLLAIAVFPTVVLATLLAVLVADGVAMAIGLGAEAVRDGGLACVAVLTTLATAYSLGADRIDLVIAGAVLAVLFTAAFQAMFARLALPSHSWPLVAAAWTVNLAARVLPSSPPPEAFTSPLTRFSERLMEPGWLDVPASIVFLHGRASGLLLVVAIALYSRIGLLLAAIGGASALAVHAMLRGPIPWSPIDLSATFNAVLCAMAIGGVWYVPQPPSMLMAAGAAMATCVVTYALLPIAGVLALPLLSLPFVVTTHIFLTALRTRQRDRSPASAIPGESPEDTLSFHLMRVRRFGDYAWLPFRLPFRGTWVVTQGHDGAHTHKGAWRHAFDFEARGPDGQTFTGDGRGLQDYRCYGLPVLAAGGGTVDQVVDAVPDNPVGGINARDNWGNVVVIAHGSNLYSVCAHLQPRSVRVKPGDPVKAGAEIGRCGNSGRSPVPHLHFHVQRGPVLGSETIPADFGDVVARTDGTPMVSHRVIPAEGDIVRPVGRDEPLADALAFPPGSSWALVDAGHGRREVARVEIDLFGRRVLRSAFAELYIEPYDTGLVTVAFHGARESLLRYVSLALARVPFDQEATLTWRDRVPRRLTLGWPWTLLDDLVAVVAPRLADFEITYTSQRTERGLVVEGVAAGFTTRAVISLGSDPLRVEVERDGARTIVDVIALPDETPEKAS